MEKLSHIITCFIKKNGTLVGIDEDLCEYGIYNLLLEIVNIILTLLIGIFTNMLSECLIFTIAYIPLRIFAGGFHAKTPMLCTIISAIILYVNVLLIKRFSENFSCGLFLVTVISVVLVLFFAPISSRNKKLDKKEKRVYHTMTIVVLSFEFFAELIFLKFNYVRIATIFQFVFITVFLMLILGKIDLLIEKFRNKTR